MLDQNFVSTLLNAGLTGAGLTLAIYTLIMPITRNILETRAIKYIDEIKEVRGKVVKLGTNEETPEDIEKLKTLLDEIKDTGNMPWYLTWGTGGAFALFTLTAMMSVAWSVGWEIETMDKFLAGVFQFALIVFLIVGYITVKDLTMQFNKEYNSIKKEGLKECE